MTVVKPDRERLEANPSLFLEELIKKYVISSPSNRIEMYNNDPIFDEPLVGFSDGYDPIFKEYKNETIIGDFHLTPREALSTYLVREGKGVTEKQPRHLSVISVVFPLCRNIRLSARRENFVSDRWSNTHIISHETILEETLNYVVSLLEQLGYQAAAPPCYKPPIRIQSSHGEVSDWSDKHAAYAAGLGTFSLSRSLITPKGKAVFLGSVITDLAISPTPRIYDNHLANCLFYRDRSCTRCIKRCSAGAISEQGYDVSKCLEKMEALNERVSPEVIEAFTGKNFTQEHILCGLCQTKVPCEDRIPPSKSAKNQEKSF
jgi:epoxyqueuosine reductase